MSGIYCNRCGHQNPGESNFCSSCGAPLDPGHDLTITLTNIDPLQDAPGREDDVTVSLADIPEGMGVLIVRSTPQTGDKFVLTTRLTRLGRHPDSEISLDDITVSRRHADIEHVDGGYVVRDAGSLNGTYLNQQRIDEAALRHGDELQIGKFRMLFFESPAGAS